MEYVSLSASCSSQPIPFTPQGDNLEQTPPKPSHTSQLPHRPASASVLEKDDVTVPETLGSTQSRSTGTKRARSGRSITPPLPDDHIRTSQRSSAGSSVSSYLTPPGSASEVGGSSFYSDSYSDDEYDHGSDRSTLSDSEEDTEEEDFVPDEAFQQMRRDLVVSSYPKAREWEARAIYTSPREERCSCRKRARARNGRVQSLYIEDEEDESDSELVVVSRPTGSYHFACPFNLANPQKHKRCVTEHDLLSIKDVIQHLGRHHMKPPYCPMCYNTFNTLAARDDHLKERSCTMSDCNDIEGITESQKTKLAKQDKVYLSNRERWYCIWTFLFPELETPSSPYLRSGLGIALSKVRDYWRIYGLASVSAHMSKQAEHYENVSAARNAMYGLVLEDLLRLRGEEYSHIQKNVAGRGQGVRG